MTQRVVKQYDLMNMLTGPAAKRNAVLARWEEVSLMQSVLNVFLVDKEDDVENMTVNLTGVSDLIGMAREDLAAASGLSVQRFFGLQQQGLSNNDETGSERDDAVIASFQRDHLSKAVNRIVELGSASMNLESEVFGAEFLPLREETPGARATRKKSEAETAEIYAAKIRAVDREEVRATLRADADPAFQLQTQEIRKLYPEDPEPSLPPVNSPGQPTSEQPEPPKE